MRAILRFFFLVFGMVGLLTVTAGTAAAANGCSIYSNYGGNSGKTWFNEHYYGSTVPDFLEIFSRNSKVTASNPSIWDKWYIRIYDKNNTVHTFPLSEKTTACTTSGGRTYITHTPGWNLNFNDAMIAVFDGPPDNSSTREIDVYAYSNANPPTPYNDNQKYYTPTCGAIKSALDSQVSAARNKTTYQGQNLLILPNFNNKDNSRIPDGTGNWEETSEGGSGTTFTQCVTNDPVDIVKSFTWAPTLNSPVHSGAVDPGAVITFTVSATNATKASMTGVKISDTLPTGLTLSGTPTASAGASASCSGTPATCVLTAPATLLPATTVSMTFNATVTTNSTFAGATIRNEAVQTGGTTYSPAPIAEAFVIVGSGLSLTIATDKTPAVYSSNERVNFTVVAENRTDYPMAGAKVTIPFPTGLNWSSSVTPVASSGTVTCTNLSCVWTLPATLEAKAAPTLTFQAIAAGTPGQQMTVTATQTAGATLSTQPSTSIVVTMAAAPGAGFNACHNYAATDVSSCSNLKARLYTRLAGAVFTTDIVALKSDGTVYKDFVGAGGAARTVKVELIDQINGNPVATKDVAFPQGDTTGRIEVIWAALNKAYPKLQVRITDSNGASAVTTMSSDSFAVRPSAVTISTNAFATSPGVESTPVIKAGTPFTIKAVTSPATGYAGALAVDAAKLTGTSGMGNFRAADAAAAFTLKANESTSDNATYSEVGYLYAAAGAFRDDSFTEVDRNNGDCISSTTDNHHLSDELVNGKYGCSIGNKTAISFGRFIPDHFIVTATLQNRADLSSCTSSFTYMGEPMRLVLSMTARNIRNEATVNYTSDFARLNATVAANWTSFDVNGSIGLGGVSGTTPLTPPRLAVSNPGGTWKDGVGTLTADVVVNRAASPDGPFASLQFGVAPKDLDGVRVLPAALDLDVDPATPATKEHQLVATTNVRYGRVRLINAHGSELLPLSVPLRLEYFKAGTGFVAANDDTCTDFAVSALTLSNPRVNMTEDASTPSFVRKPSSGGVLSDIRLTAPGAGRNGSIDLQLTVPTWLQFAWGGGNSNPRARATFGVYKGNNHFIYLRENY